MRLSEMLHKHRPASVLILSIFFLSIITILVVTTLERSESNVRSTSRRVNDQESLRIAEAGIEKAVWCLNNPSNTTDCPNNPNYTGETDVSFGRGSFTIAVTGSGNSRTLSVTSTIDGSGGPTTKQIEALITTSSENVSFQYGVQAGIGGIDLANNAYISGNVYAGGSVTGGNGSYITGDAILTPNSPTLDAASDPGVSPLSLITFSTDKNSDDTLAQSFVPSLTDQPFSIDFKIAKNNNPSGNLTFYIYDDNSGNPGSNLSGSGQTVNATIPSAGTPGWENGWTSQVFTPSVNPVLSSGQTYWLVIESSSAHSSNNWRVVRDADNMAYANGQALLDRNTTTMPAACSGSGCDIAFRINMGGVKPTLNIPTVSGNGFSNIIKDTTIGGEAHYQNLVGTVKADGGSDTCAESENGPFCFDNAADQPPANFPLSDAQIAQMEAQAAAGGTTTCSPTCTITNGSSIGPHRYDGDVVISNGDDVTLIGTVWVNGDLSIDNNGILRLSDAYGSNSGLIIADYPADRTAKGKVTLFNNGNILGNATPDTYIMTISMHNDPAFSAATINASNNLTAAVLYAPYGIININNNASLKEVTAQKIVLEENASVIYETGLANVNFTSGPGGSWVYQKGSYQVIN